MTTLSQYTSQDGGKVTVQAFGQRTIASVHTLDIRPATTKDKGKRCVCGHAITVLRRHAWCSCDNPRVFMTLLLLCVMLLGSCGRATFSFNGGKVVKEKRLLPGKAYPIGIAFSIGLGEQYKIKH